MCDCHTSQISIYNGIQAFTTKACQTDCPHLTGKLELTKVCFIEFYTIRFCYIFQCCVPKFASLLANVRWPSDRMRFFFVNACIAAGVMNMRIVV